MFRDNIVFQEYFFPDRTTFKISSMFQADYNVRDGSKFEMKSVITCSIMAKNKKQPYLMKFWYRYIY